MNTSRPPRALMIGASAVMTTALALTVWPPRQPRACLHAMSQAPRTVLTTNTYQALALADATQQHLIVSIGLAEGQPVEGLSWVLPIPAPPDTFETLSLELFDELETKMPVRLFSKLQLAGGGGSGGPRQALEEFPAARVGPYEIQPIRGHGEQGARALRAWMTEHGYQPVPSELLTHYVEREWTFLAVRVVAPPGEELTAGALPPLQVSFPRQEDALVFPTRILAASGSFPLRFYAVTPHPADLDGQARHRRPGLLVDRPLRVDVDPM